MSHPSEPKDLEVTPSLPRPSRPPRRPAAAPSPSVHRVTGPRAPRAPSAGLRVSDGVFGLSLSVVTLYSPLSPAARPISADQV